MVSRAAMIWIALVGVSMCVMASAGDVGQSSELLETSAAVGNDALEGAAGRSLLNKSAKKYFVYQNADNTAFIFDPDTQVVVGSGAIFSSNKNTVNQAASNSNGRKLLTNPAHKYVVFQNAQNKATIVDPDTQVVYGSGIIFSSNKNTVNQAATNSNGRKLLTKPTKKYVVFQNAQNYAVIFDPDTQIVVGDGAIYSTNKNTINQSATNTNGRKLLTKSAKKYVVFQNAQNYAVIFDPDTQIVIGDGAIYNTNKNTVNQAAANNNG